MSVAPTPAAQYLRMSTDQQEYSLLNQSSANQLYATMHCFTIVQTYADEGRSGVVINRRPQLQRLLHDVRSGRTEFKAILVYDVSRWGRFQDMDEAAHYEFICKKAGVPVHYCAEAFANDGAMASLFLKWLKRAMAGEYSRELSMKVSAGVRRLATLGFRMGSAPSHGYRRLLVDSDRQPKQLLVRGERKNLAQDRVVLVPGPTDETKTVKAIYQMFLRRNMMPAEIAKRLNDAGVPYNGGFKRHQWYPQAVNRTLKNPTYAGWLIYGKHTQKLKTPRRKVPPENWIAVREAWEPIVEQATFDAAQKRFLSQTWHLSDDDLLDHLREILKKHGRITHLLVAKTPGPSIGAYSRRFGSLTEAMKRMGYSGATGNSLGPRRFMREQRRILVQQIRDASPIPITIEQPDGHWRERLLLSDGLLLSIYPARHYTTKSGESRWIVNPVMAEGRSPALLVRMRPGNDDFMDFHVVAGTGRRTRITLRVEDTWLARGKKLNSLSELVPAARALALERGLLPGSARGEEAVLNRIRFA